MFGFLFWLFFIGIVVASLQDLKRREVDNWLNLFLIVSGVVYLLFENFVSGDFVYSVVLVAFAGITSFLYFYNGDMFSDIESCKRKYYCLLSFICLLFVAIVFLIVKVFGMDNVPFFMIAASAFLIMFVVSNLFYEGRVFAGGDAKLLFAMSAFFVAASFFGTLVNIGIFLLFLMFSGSVYGLLYSFVLYARDYKKVNREMRKGFGKLWVRSAIVLSVVLFVLSYFDLLFLMLGSLLLLLPLLYVFAKGLENVSMIRVVSGNELREGDWLVDDVKVKGKIIRADWDGLSLEDIELLKRKKKVEIKDGLPFVPAFLIAFLGYVFLKGWVVSFFIGLA
jgi:Flp pilus assembly protein protease CpaA